MAGVLAALLVARAEELVLVNDLLPVVGPEPLLAHVRRDHGHFHLLQLGWRGDLAVSRAAPPDHLGLGSHVRLLRHGQADCKKRENT